GRRTDRGLADGVHDQTAQDERVQNVLKKGHDKVPVGGCDRNLFFRRWDGHTVNIPDKRAKKEVKPMPMAEINGTRLHYHATGKAVPLALIPPPLLSRGIFRYQTEALSGSFTVITFDVRGRGGSAPSAAPVTHPVIAEDVRQLLDHLGIERAFIGGYSTGAQVALEALLAYPDR